MTVQKAVILTGFILATAVVEGEVVNVGIGIGVNVEAGVAVDTRGVAVSFIVGVVAAGWQEETGIIMKAAINTIIFFMITTLPCGQSESGQDYAAETIPVFANN